MPFGNSDLLKASHQSFMVRLILDSLRTVEDCQQRGWEKRERWKKSSQTRQDHFSKLIILFLFARRSRNYPKWLSLTWSCHYTNNYFFESTLFLTESMYAKSHCLQQTQSQEGSGVAQLAERSLRTPEVWSLIQVIGEFLKNIRYCELWV